MNASKECVYEPREGYCDGFIAAWNAQAGIRPRHADAEEIFSRLNEMAELIGKVTEFFGMMLDAHCEPGTEPYKTCTLCYWHDLHNRKCIKGDHRACPDWEPLM